MWDTRLELGLGLLVVCILGALFVMPLISPAITGYLMIASIVVVAVVVASIFGYVIYWLIRNRLCPTTRVTVRVVRKRHKNWDVSLPLYAPPTEEMMGRDPKGAWEAYSRMTRTSDMPEIELASGTECFVTFAIGREQLELNVPMNLYIQLQEGDEGLLVFQGEIFRHFIPGVT